MRPIKSLKEYESRYKNYKRKLFRFTKQEVAEFDKTADTIGQHYVLKHRKWVLLGDTYYEIPRPIRWTWFRSLNAGVQIATCALLAGAIGGGAYGTYYLITNKSKDLSSLVELDSSIGDYIKIQKVEKNSDGDLLIHIEVKEVEAPGELQVKKGDHVLLFNSEWFVEPENSDRNAVIKVTKTAVDKYPGKVIIYMEEYFDGKVTEEQWENAISVVLDEGENRNYKVELENEYDEHGIITVKNTDVSSEWFDDEGALSGQNDYEQKNDDGVIFYISNYIDEGTKDFTVDHIYDSDYDLTIIKEYLDDINDLSGQYQYFSFDNETKSYFLSQGSEKTYVKFNSDHLIESCIVYENEVLKKTVAFSDYGKIEEVEIEEPTNYFDCYYNQDASAFINSEYGYPEEASYCCYQIDFSRVQSFTPGDVTKIELLDDDEGSPTSHIVQAETSTPIFMLDGVDISDEATYDDKGFYTIDNTSITIESGSKLVMIINKDPEFTDTVTLKVSQE